MAPSSACALAMPCCSLHLPSPLASPPEASALPSRCAAFSRGLALRKSGASFDTRSGQLGQRRNSGFRVDASINPVGEFGARDPYPAEVESNFGEKVIGNEGTDHIILIPPSLLGLAERSCTPLPSGCAPLTEQEAIPLLRKVIGWRLLKSDQGLKIWTEWKVKDFASGITLLNRIAAVAEAECQYPEFHLVEGNRARAELSSHSIGGLSLNDFIFAAKIDQIRTSDLVKKNRVWA